MGMMQLNLDTQLSRSNLQSPGAGYAVDPPEVAAEMTATQLLNRIQLLLRGRWLLLIILTVVFAAAAGYTGYRAGKVTFQSVGTVRVEPRLLRMMYTLDDAGMIPMFDAYMVTQAMYVRDQRTIDLAMQSPEWVATGRGTGEQAYVAFRAALQAIPKYEIVYVSFEDEDPKVALVAVNVVLAAYDKRFQEGDSREIGRLQWLQQLQTSASRDVAGLEQQRTGIVKKYPTDDLEARYRAQAELVQKYQTLLDNLEFARMANDPGKGGARAKMLPEQIAAEDAFMARLLDGKQAAEARLEQLRAQNLGDAHRDVQAALLALGAANKRVAQRAEEYLKQFEPGGAAEQHAATIKAKVEAESVILSAIGADVIQLRELQPKLDAARASYRETTQRIAQLTVEQPAMSDRIKVTLGDRPSVPYRDTRIRFAVAGAMGGMLLAAGIVLALAAADRRLRGPDEASASPRLGPLLGIVPSLPTDLSDPDGLALAAHSVHQIRTLLQVPRPGAGEQRVFAISSPRAGAGKTSLTLALGAAFATAGSRTLLIDCDLVGSGLTRRLNAVVRRKMGTVLINNKWVSREQAMRAIAHARAHSGKTGESCVKLGFIDESKLEEAIRAQENSRIGILDAVAGAHLDLCAVDTGVRNLRILPVGSAAGRNSCNLSLALMRRLLASARDLYDIVIVDTGPAPCSLEAAVVAAEVDSVIITLCRGDDRPAALRCVEHVTHLGGRVAGVVFNRANRREMDLIRSTSFRSASDAGTSSSMLGLEVDLDVTSRLSQLGPLGQAVAGCSSTT